MNQFCSFIVVSNKDEEISLISNIIAELYPINQIQYSNNIEDFKLILEKSSHYNFIIFDNEHLNFDLNLFKNEIKDKYNLHNSYILLISSNDSIYENLFTLGFDDLYLTPLILNNLKVKIKIAFNNYSNNQSLKTENSKLKKINNELESDFENVIKITSKIVQKPIPVAYDILNKVADASAWIAKQFPNIDEIEIKEIKIASYLCLVGKTYLPEYMLNEKVLVNGRLVNPIMFQVPLTAREIFKDVERFSTISHIIYHIYENLDGSGIPEKITAWQIPIGSRIIRVVLDFEELIIDGFSKQQAIEILESNVKRIYDNRIVYLFNQYLLANPNEFDFDNTEIPIKLLDLKENMTISRDVIATSGIKILSKGTIITQRIIDIIYSHITSDPILGYIFVKK
jgi:response regulator RpfG family c-di-GMP phosphodiesterase